VSGDQPPALLLAMWMPTPRDVMSDVSRLDLAENDHVNEQLTFEIALTC
jgi:hypothetical protein